MLKNTIYSLKCFTLSERREMLKKFSEARYNDSLATAAINLNAELQSKIVTTDHMLAIQKKINEDYRTQLANKDEIEVNFQKEIKIKENIIVAFFKNQKLFSCVFLIII